MRGTRQLLGALALAGALGTAGCGGSNDAAGPAQSTASEPGTTVEDVMTEETTAQGTTTGASSSATSDGAKVTIQGLAYKPVKLMVTAGTTLVWTNRDTAQHTVTSDQGTALHSKLLKKGDSYEIELSDPGTYSYYCKVHPFMKATVTVEPS